MTRHAHLTVDAKPFLSLGGQAHNSSAFTAEDTDYACRSVRAIGGNTVALPISWEAFEPEEGTYDDSLVRRVLDQVRQAGLRLVVLWFGTWKNGTMEYCPAWVKQDQHRFPRTQYPNGEPTFVLSCHSEANREADARAFAALMALIHDLDTDGTIVAVQVENEVGIYAPVQRDFGPDGERDFSASVPAELLSYTREHPDTRLHDRWRAEGAVTAGTWAEVFGSAAAELCTTWHVARYVDAVAAAGRAAHDVPLIANVWADTGFWGVGGLDYPCGGPVYSTPALDIWRAAARSLDMICPDVYVADSGTYREMVDAYAAPEQGWPLFVPESANRHPNTAFMFHALGVRGAAGLHVFGVEDLLGPDGNLTEAGEAFARSFSMLQHIAPLLLDHRASGDVHTFVQVPGERSVVLPVQGWLCSVSYVGPEFRWNATDFRHLDGLADEYSERHSLDDELARGLVVQTGDNEFFLVGHGARAFFQPMLPLDGSVPYSLIGSTHQAASMPTISVDEGHLDALGEFVVDRVRTGDEARHGIWLSADSGLVRLRFSAVS